MNNEWKGLVYNDIDFSDVFEYNESGCIRNKCTGNVMSRSGNYVAINYFGDVRRINIPLLLTGNPAPRKPRSHTTSQKNVFSEKQETAIRVLVRQEVLKILGSKYND